MSPLGQDLVPGPCLRTPKLMGGTEQRTRWGGGKRFRMALMEVTASKARAWLQLKSREAQKAAV
jgi:hypothetical protein